MFKDNDKEDFFNAPIEAETPKKPKEPKLKPDDPRYYEREDEWEHIRPASRNWKMWMWIIIGGVAFGLLYAAYLRWMNPYSEGTVQYGYVETIYLQGDVFKTYEGVIIPYKAINDTIEPYSGDLVFSVNDTHLAAELKKLQLANLPARIEYSEYHATLPWRGASRIVVTAVDTADVTKIWPVTLNHPLIPAAE